jgi:hypothetical protein
MKFIKREPDENMAFLQNERGWVLSELISSKKVLIIGLIVGIISTGLLAFIIKTVIFCADFDFHIYKKLYLIVLIIPLHEFVHLLFFPNLNNSTFGVLLHKAVFFVTTNDVLSGKRFLAVSLMPVFLLTVVPVVVLFFIQSEFLAYLALYNLLGSGVDIVSSLIILKQSKNNVFRFCGAKLYVKQVEQKAL